MPDLRHALGVHGEQLAERALAERGWRIIARNVRTRFGEIDLVCHDGSGFVFVEVKTRRATSFVSAIEAAGPRKVVRLGRLAENWLGVHHRRGSPWRIAVLALTVGPGGIRAQLADAIDG
ncbi:MAG: YraN family protein [Chloroflexota bacterium]|nr:YraN family protein [Chloroflexota bacterium]MDE3192209.1 YraN family protein [Chloroflexota bacterium]